MSTGGRVDFRLLGPVQVWSGAHQLDGGQQRQRCVLAALLVDCGRLVTWQDMVDRVWGEKPPAGVRGTLRAHLSRVRRVLESGGDGAGTLLFEAGG